MHSLPVFVLGVVTLAMVVLTSGPTALYADAAGAEPAGRTFYVDFEAGSDEMDGGSPERAFQRAPGDPASRHHAARVELQAGDTVIFKGGVRYRGHIELRGRSGEPGRPITFDGNTQGTFGQGRAVLDGSDPASGWRRVETADDVAGNQHWGSIWVADVEGGIGPLAANLHQAERRLALAMSPPPRDPFYQDLRSDYREIPEAERRPSSVRDPALFTQDAPDAWDHAVVGVYEAHGNSTYFSNVTGYAPDTRTLTWDGERHTPTGFAVLNHPRLIIAPGQYAVERRGDHTRIYVWPWDERNLDRIMVSRRSRAVSIDASDHVTIRGFRMLGQRGAAVHVRHAAFVTILENELTLATSGVVGRAGGGAAIDMSDVRDVLIQANHIHNNTRIGGITINPGQRVVVRDNRIRKTGYVGIWLLNVHHGQVIANDIRDNHATHANAISVYLACRDILVADNRVFGSSRPLTASDVTGLVVYNNIFHGDNDLAVAFWTDGDVHALVAHNVLTGARAVDDSWSRDIALFSNNEGEGSNFLIMNNIVDGIYGRMPGRLTGNLFLRDATFGDFDPASNRLAPDSADVFLDASNHDYRLVEGSPAVGAGVDLDALLPRDTFPGYDFDRDIAGRSRPAGPGVDAGVHQLENHDLR
ncbi:MAG: right-handed parallel beta-helix repeat-containing protein [Phycisphaeraceae bacterium]